MYQDSTQLFQTDFDYAADWSLPLDFSEFLNQDFTQQDVLPTGHSTVSEPGLQLDLEALLASTTTSSCDSSIATTTTASSATFTPVDFSTRSDNAPATFDSLTTAPATSFETSPPLRSLTDPDYASIGCSPATGAMRVDIPAASSWASFSGHQPLAGNLTPPPSVTNIGPHSKSASPVAAAKARPVSPTTSDSPLEVTGESRKRKRERNTEAARRYRQRRQDRLEELEEALAAMTKDRDELRLKLARSEAETDVLKGLMAKK